MRTMIIMSCAAWLATAPIIFAQEWSEGFEDGLGSAKIYIPDQGTTLEIGADRPAEGKQYVRAVLTGKTTEGFNVTATGLTGGCVAKVTAKVRGKGNLWPSLISRNGWRYSNGSVKLTDQWQEISLGKTLVKEDTSLGIHFITAMMPQPGAVFEVDDIQVRLEPPPQVYDAEVGPWRFEAEDFSRLHSEVGDDPQASGGKVIRHGKYMEMTGLPFPRTSEPVTVYLRVKPVSTDEEYRLETAQSGAPERLKTVKPAQVGAWQWLAFEPVITGEVGDTFGITLATAKDASGEVAFDQAVLSTRSDLSPENLDAAPLWNNRHPLVVVARTATPPTLDGKGNDPCWRNTVACTGFVKAGSLGPAQAATCVRLCYDQSNLYLFFVCQEPVLKVVAQSRAQFLDKITQRDGNVYEDDSVVVLLDPANTGKQVFDFFVNALGTIADARCPGPDLWESRDVKWNSGTRAKGNIDDGVWSVEMAIPFADLGKAPKPGDAWQVGLGRLAKERKETTSWNPSGGGFHAPVDHLGYLVFGGEMPGVLLNAPDCPQLGQNPLSVTLSTLAGQPCGAYLMTDMTTSQDHNRSRQYAFVAASEPPAEVSRQFKLSATSEVKLQYAVLDAGSLTPWYVSPSLPRVTRNAVAEVQMSCDGPYELFLNDEIVDRGAKASGKAIKANLKAGANVFALKLEKGTAAIRVGMDGGQLITAESWKVASADTKDATCSGLDDMAWPLAGKTGDDSSLGPVVGEAGKAVVLRRTLFFEKTRIWPQPIPAYYMARGAPQHLTVRTEGVAGKKLEGWTTYLATPPDFEVIGSTGFYGATTADQPKFVCAQLGIQQIQGRKMRVVKVTADKPLLSGRHFIMSEFEVFLRYREEDGEPRSTETEFLYWNEANGGNVTEPVQRFKVRLLPKLDGRQPKQLCFQVWGGWLCDMDDRTLREEVLKCAQASGFNCVVDSGSSDWLSSDLRRKYGVELQHETNFASWEMNLAPWLKEHPDQRLISFTGKPRDANLCMSLLLGDGWPAVEQVLKKRLDAVRPDAMDLDYEYSPKDGEYACYCPRCLAAFREFAKLVPGAALDPATIQEKHADLWLDFMGRRLARMFAKFKEATHRLAPGTKFTIYSGYQTPASLKHSGVNWKDIGDLQACDRAGCGYGEPEPDMWRTVEVLQGIPLMPGAIVYPYDRTLLTPVTPLTRAGVLRLLLAGNGGVLVYERASMDGRCWRAVADVSRLAAAHEEVFLKGARSVALPGFHITQVQSRQSGGTTLVCALNITGKPVEYTITLPAEAGAGAEFYSGKKVTAGAQVTCNLEPGDAAVYVLRKNIGTKKNKTN